MSDDREEIAYLIARYSHVYDSGDFDQYGELFRHGEIANSTSQFTSSAALAAHHRNNTPLFDGKPGTRHVTTNVCIDVDPGATTASAISYVTVFQAAPNLPLQAIFVGSYIDKFHKIDGKWWFKSRKVEPHLVGDLSYHANPPYLPPTDGQLAKTENLKR
jgi:hypothetical protein